MKSFKTIALTTVAVLGVAAAPAFAQQERTAGFTSHHLVSKKDYENYAEQLPAEAKLELRNYLDYETDREQCQGYREPPAGLLRRDPCDLEARQQQQRVAVIAVRPAQRQAQAPQREPVELRPVVQDYEVNFDFDKAEIRPTAEDTLRRVAREIEMVNPAEVTIVGHADRAGPAEYNVALSRARAENVSQALTRRGIPNRVLDQRAVGENNPVVETNDGIPLEENRRVEIQFRK